ncbi:galactose oxidase-like domain-containing protein [Actinoplanes palleronii]|uniref:galactose oxidase-like domain-containing protein n=1 Tax=Actinoplanes palleronii TaxID=113570 RepID=UPI001EF32A14|nr:galactose oxidase-like domain-containing protein [Actinoplanes palleronii]
MAGRAEAGEHVHEHAPAAAPGHEHAPGAVPGHLQTETGHLQEEAEHEHGAQAVDDSPEHMAEDLVGTPVRVIEEQTAATAARIQRETGLRPGVARSRANVAADPGVSGEWSPVTATSVVPVFVATLPNGKMLIWDSVGDNAAESYPDHSFTRAMVWNPVDGTEKRIDLQGTNIFCAGFAHLANGNILIAGGNANKQLQGTVRTYVFDWQAETWTRGKDMAAGRWYPSVAQTANGEEVIIGGGPATAEVYQTDGAIRPLSGFTQYSARLYPFLASRPDAQLGLFGPHVTGYTITTAGNGVITATTNRDGIYRDYGSFSTYDIGKSLVVGGGSVTEGGVAKVPTRTAVVVNSGVGSVPSFAATGSMATGRRQFSATVLADGSVLATGGLASTAKSSLVDLDNAVTAAERWDPATGQWTGLASASRIRQYHSTAALLPDGRVMTGGGGICSTCMTVGYLEKNVEYFSPPYLFAKDGSGAPAVRPVISTAPASVGINTNFAVTSAQAAGIKKVALVGLADVTHGVDQGQRYVPLKFSVSGTTLTVTGPPNGGVAPPGYYMLFVIDANGVPSVAKIVQVAKGPSPVMSQVKNNTGRCVDVPSSAIASRTYLQLYNCNGSKAQSLTRLPDDRTLRIMGNCLDVPSGNYVNNQRLWAYTCNRSGPQTWQFNADGTIRPVGNTTLCLSAASSLNQAILRLNTCTGVVFQKWTY